MDEALICEKTMYAVYRTKRFEKELFKQFSKIELWAVEKFERKQLTVNPMVGDPLNYTFLREKKLGGKRVYYLVYEDLKAVLMIAVSNKKTQQATIDEIKSKLRDYYLLIKEIIKRHDESGHA